MTLHDGKHHDVVPILEDMIVDALADDFLQKMQVLAYQRQELCGKCIASALGRRIAAEYGVTLEEKEEP